MLSLFQIQDDDRPMWVVAESFSHAIKRWRKQMAKENPGNDDCNDQPNGVILVASGTDLDDFPEILLPSATMQNENKRNS